MSVRIGVGAVPAVGDPDLRTAVGELVDESEELGIDSVWFSDLVSSPAAADPLVAMGFAVGRTSSLKVGSGVLILPGRNPAIVAAQLASLAALAPRRILPVFGSRPVRGPDRPAFAAAGPSGTSAFEEALQVVRALLSAPASAPAVDHHGEHFHLDGVRIAPLPPRPLDLWLGGRVPAALERVGRLGDGWLASFVTPAEAASARAAIESAAAAVSRGIDDDHYGTNLVVARTEEHADRATAAAAAQRRDLDDPSELVCRGWEAAREQLRRFIDAGVTKFVVRPAGPVASRRGWLEELTQELLPLET